MKNVVGFALGVVVGYKGLSWCVHITYISIIIFIALTKLPWNDIIRCGFL